MKNFLSKNGTNFLQQKYTPSKISTKDFAAPGEAFSPHERKHPSIQKFVFQNVFLFCGAMMVFDPDLLTQLNPDPGRNLLIQTRNS
jgi:hypothetical protein